MSGASDGRQPASPHDDDLDALIRAADEPEPPGAPPGKPGIIAWVALAMLVASLDQGISALEPDALQRDWPDAPQWVGWLIGYALFDALFLLVTGFLLLTTRAGWYLAMARAGLLIVTAMILLTSGIHLANQGDRTIGAGLAELGILAAVYGFVLGGILFKPNVHRYYRRNAS